MQICLSLASFGRRSRLLNIGTRFGISLCYPPHIIVLLCHIAAKGIAGPVPCEGVAQVWMIDIHLAIKDGNGDTLPLRRAYTAG